MEARRRRGRRVGARITETAAVLLESFQPLSLGEAETFVCMEIKGESRRLAAPTITVCQSPFCSPVGKVVEVVVGRKWRGGDASAIWDRRDRVVFERSAADIVGTVSLTNSQLTNFVSKASSLFLDMSLLAALCFPNVRTYRVLFDENKCFIVE